MTKSSSSTQGPLQIPPSSPIVSAIINGNGAHATTGNYSIVGGTGRFTQPRGTGAISIETRPDGISSITITGGCFAGMCGLFSHR